MRASLGVSVVVRVRVGAGTAVERVVGVCKVVDVRG